MCIECGCESLGSETGIVPVSIADVTTQGSAGLTLGMTATRSQMNEFSKEG